MVLLYLKQVLVIRILNKKIRLCFSWCSFSSKSEKKKKKKLSLNKSTNLSISCQLWIFWCWFLCKGMENRTSANNREMEGWLVCFIQCTRTTLLLLVQIWHYRYLAPTFRTPSSFSCFVVKEYKINWCYRSFTDKTLMW
jgi:hypothetical protein